MLLQAVNPNKMSQTYYQKENIYIWYFIIILSVGLLIFGYTLARYFVWQILPLLFMAGGKIYSLNKRPEIPAIELNENSIVLLTSPESPSYSYSDISSIYMDSKSFNGYLKLKNEKKKIRINSVAIALEDQNEIVAFVNNKINQV